MIQAIETSYAGCRFRSRLEAKWAVFFDALDIEWQYEAQGYVLGDGSHYLPDFWLPRIPITSETGWHDRGSRNYGVHVEVKGEEPRGTAREKIKQFVLIDCDPPVNGPKPTNEVLVLSSHPRMDGETWPGHSHVRNAWYDASFPGDTYSACVGVSRFTQFGGLVIEDVQALDFDSPHLTEAWYTVPYKISAKVDEAYCKARSARFEHGQSGGFNVGA